MNNFDFKNKTAIITGGAQGFGLDIAKKFLKFGTKLILLFTPLPILTKKS